MIFAQWFLQQIEGNDNQNGRKRRQTRRLGPKWVLFFFSSWFFNTN